MQDKLLAAALLIAALVLFSKIVTALPVAQLHALSDTLKAIPGGR